MLSGCGVILLFFLLVSGIPGNICSRIVVSRPISYESFTLFLAYLADRWIDDLRHYVLLTVQCISVTSGRSESGNERLCGMPLTAEKTSTSSESQSRDR